MLTSTLTPLERTVLANQFKILAALDPRERDQHLAAAAAFELGLTRFYPDRARPFRTPEVSEQKIDDFTDLLHMFRCIDNAIKAGVDVEGIHPDRLRFIGFDGNHEDAENDLADFLTQHTDWYAESLIPGLNSHGPTVDRYQRQLDVWRRLPNASSAELTRKDLQALADAATYPKD